MKEIVTDKGWLSALLGVLALSTTELEAVLRVAVLIATFAVAGATFCEKLLTIRKLGKTNKRKGDS